MGEPRGRKKPDDSQVLRMAVFQVAFLGECLVIFLEKCLECWESLGSVKFVVIQRSCIAGMQDPEVMVAFQDVTQKPANMSKYQSNPKVRNLISKLLAKFGDQA